LSRPRTILVTSALPYANESLHIGHLVEYVQTDVWVRFQRLRGHRCIYVCASDAHGTPTMLRGEKEGIPPDQLIARVVAEHRRDFETFRISVDNYLTTHSDENRTLTDQIYKKLAAAGHIVRRTIRQAYDDEKKMFLPDRYVRGTCPNCGKPGQYGDSCENCSTIYSPLDLVDPVSVLSGTRPVVRESEHLFLRLSTFTEQLRAWVPEHVDAAMSRKLEEWFTAGLEDWDISRDPPYFGFPVPGEPGKFFYVWFDALIGYMSSFANLCAREKLDFDAFWGKDSRAELYHFIGKDIVYFHSLFWPAMLEGAGYRKPSGIFVHGFLTVDGEKMSKSRGTFIKMATYAKHLDPDYVRYYYASKLGPGVDDIDLNFADFTAKVNADLVGKLVNIASRCASFVQRLNDGLLAAELPDRALFAEFTAAAPAIAEDYERRDFARAVRRVMALADRANQYIDEQKPWVLVKDAKAAQKVVGICTLGINLFRSLIVFLKPVIPGVAERAEKLLGGAALTWSDVERPLLGRQLAKFEPLLQRVEEDATRRIVEDERGGTTAMTNERIAAKTAPTGAAEAATESAATSEIDLELFSKIDLRVARIAAAKYVEGADKLLELSLDLGNGEHRTVFAGIRSAYDPATLTDKHVVVVANLKPRKMRFGTSQGMVLAASGDGPGVFLLSPDSGAAPGMKVR
jgi:methionyl-tRNA synthetase